MNLIVWSFTLKLVLQACYEYHLTWAWVPDIVREFQSVWRVVTLYTVIDLRIKLWIYCVFVCVVKYKREADAGSLEHVDNDLAALCRLWALAQCCRCVLLQCILARLLCRLLSHVPWCCTLPRNVATGQCADLLLACASFWLLNVKPVSNKLCGLRRETDWNGRRIANSWRCHKVEGRERDREGWGV